MKKRSLIALCLLALGVPVLLLWQPWRRPEPKQDDPPIHDPQEVKKADPKELPPADAAALGPGDADFLDANTAADRPSVNLLRLPAARLERTTARPGDADGLAALTDDNRRTVAEATAATDAPLDVVYGFGGRTVTAEALLVRLPQPERPGAVTGRIEVLVSTLSPHAGFRLVRAEPLAATAAGQVFPFPPTAARWVLLRFHPAGRAPRVAVAEAAVLGREGPPVSRYAFHESPARAIDVLARLRSLTEATITLSPDEKDLFADAADGKLDRWTFAEAALLASGVARAEARAKYLPRLEALTKEAKAAAGGASPWERGEKLLRWLHDGALAKGGYVSRQTDLGVVLDKRTYNCVSSAVLYNVLARRLGLDARAVEVPDHAFSIVYDGTRHADVETTTPLGFNPARDPKAVEAFHRRTGFVYIPVKQADRRREIGEAGLAAIVYYNHGVRLAHERRWHEALGQFFRAMSLDAELASAVKNTLTVLALWSWELAQAGKYEPALRVLDTGLVLAPRDERLLHNRKAVWTQWALALIGQKKEVEALAVLRKAAAAVPDGHFTAMQAWLFIRPAEALAAAGKWTEAIGAVEAGLPKVDPPAAAELRGHRVGLRLRWAHAEIAARRFAEALDVLEKALAADPTDRRVAAHLAFAVQEYAVAAHAADGEAGARRVLAAQVKRFARVKPVQDVAAGYVWGVVRGMLARGEYERALAFIDRCRDLLPDAAVVRYLSLAVYDAWADSLAAEKKYDRAVQVYHAAGKRGLAWPEVSRRATARLDSWANSRAEEGAWDDALALYEKYRKDLLSEEQAQQRILLMAIGWTRQTYEKDGPAAADRRSAELTKRFPGMPRLRRGVNRPALVELVRELSKAGRYEQALAVISQAGRLLGDGGDRKLYLTLLRELSAGLAARPDGDRALALLNLAELEAVLRQALTDPDGAVRTAAADTLANLRLSAAVPDLVERVADERWVTDDRGGRRSNDPLAGGKAAALAALRRLAPDQVTPALARAAQSSARRVAVWACVELGGQQDPAALVALLRALTNQDGYVRRAAADGLKERGDRAAAAALARRIADDVWVPLPRESLVIYRDEPYDGFKGLGSKDHALEALEALDRERVTPALLAALGSGHGQVRAWAAGLLGARKDPGVVPALIRALQDEDGYVRRAAAESLKKQGDKAAAPALARRVADDRWVPRPKGFIVYYGEPFDGFRGKGSKDHALAALEALDRDQVVPALRQAARSGNAAVRKWAEAELGKRKASRDPSPPVTGLKLNRPEDREDVKGVPPPKGAVVLFDGKSLDGWVARKGGPATWRLIDGAMQAQGGDIHTRQRFDGRFKLHVEFRVPFLPDRAGQKRGNSGVYVQGRYEVQILDSYGRPPGKDDCGAIYGVAAPRVNACKWPTVWQSFDIEFVAPVYKDGKQAEPARMTVYHNGVKIHDDVAIRVRGTHSGLGGGPDTPGPILLQDYGDPVQFRNVWLLPLTPGR